MEEKCGISELSASLGTKARSKEKPAPTYVDQLRKDTRLSTEEL